MNNYFVVATAKHTLNLRGKQYKIGETIPTELTEKEYEFYKDALNVESVTENIEQPTIFEKKESGKFEPTDLEKLQRELIEAKQRIAELEAKQNSNIDVALDVSGNSLVRALKPYLQNATETEVKPKRPYAKKETK